MKSRETLIRLKRFQVDEKRRQVAQIEMMIAEFERMANELDREIVAEQTRANVHDPASWNLVTVTGEPGAWQVAVERRPVT